MEAKVTGNKNSDGQNVSEKNTNTDEANGSTDNDHETHSLTTLIV